MDRWDLVVNLTFLCMKYEIVNSYGTRKEVSVPETQFSICSKE